MPDHDIPGNDAIESELKQAKRALADAEGAQKAELSDTVVINRLYYACFHAAQAVLYAKGFTPGTHGGVLSLFGSEVVLPGDASRDQGRFLNRLSELRKQADYDPDFVDEDVDPLINQSREFVSDMESLCPISE